MTKPHELGWAAGLFDGEGSLGIYRDKRSNSAKLDVSLTMIDKDPIDKLYEMLGGIYAEYTRPERLTYRWSVYGKLATAPLLMIYPYLILKKDQVRVALEFLAWQDERGSGAYTPEEYAKSEMYITLIKRLKEPNASLDKKRS